MAVCWALVTLARRRFDVGGGKFQCFTVNIGAVELVGQFHQRRVAAFAHIGDDALDLAGDIFFGFTAANSSASKSAAKVVSLVLRRRAISVPLHAWACRWRPRGR